MLLHHRQDQRLLFGFGIAYVNSFLHQVVGAHAVALFTRMQGVNSIKSLRLKTILKDSSKIAQLPRNIRDAVMEIMKMKY